jgi:predicted transposase YbfD/YdcC
MVMGQRRVDGKSNAIKAISLSLGTLALEGAIVTIDAMGTQKAISKTIVSKKADYILALKVNQSAHRDYVKLRFANPALSQACYWFTTTNDGHGRIEERECLMTDDIAWLQAEWVGLRSIVALTSSRTNKKTGVTSPSTNAEAILAAIRSHWRIENNLPGYWCRWLSSWPKTFARPEKSTLP